MKILFIARTYPPLVGGMEKFASDFYHNIKDLVDIELIANPIGKKRIIPFFVKVMFYLIINARKYDIIHFNDAILAPLILIIRIFSKSKITFTVHGLDIVYNKYGYQLLIIPFLRKADMIFPVSKHTMELCRLRNISPDILQVIPNGLDFTHIHNINETVIKAINSKIKNNSKNNIVLLSLGRLIKRKGHKWFIQNVVVKLPDNYFYIIAGDGPEFNNIDHTIKQLSLEDRVTLLGPVSDDEKTYLFSMADLFIMPNISDDNDPEGFGIVLLEAGSHGLPSIASNMEGIKDAIIDGVSGTLVEEKNSQEFIDAITQNKIDRSRILAELRMKFDWKIIRQTYFNHFNKLIYKNH